MLVMANRRLPPLLIYNPHIFMPNASGLSKGVLLLHALCRHLYCTCMTFVLFPCIKSVNKEIFLPSSCCQAMHIF
ncbi:rCG61168 [Rattus norvegicus]|uniref:RCG61168 n=1 Tax=Rattus norvegicus TaxID=10116 RepID=A6KE38_RAT|nr:rCG61168 [Rattus norvegicus]